MVRLSEWHGNITVIRSVISDPYYFYCWKIG